MIGFTSPYFWYTTRATGMVALLLFTLVVCLGTLVANRIGGTVVGRFEINELHRSVSIIAVVFLVLHITTTVVDSYVPTGWISAVVPFTSSYKRLGVAIGAIAFDLILAVWVSSLVKVRIKNQTWRFLHWFSWLAFAAALLHAVVTGTDARRGPGFVVVGLCAAAALLAGAWRYLGRPTRAGGRTALSPFASGAADVLTRRAEQPPRAPRVAERAGGSPRTLERPSDQPFDASRATVAPRATPSAPSAFRPGHAPKRGRR